MCLSMAGPTLMDLKILLLCQLTILDDLLGRSFVLPMDENGEKKELLFLIMSTPSIKIKLQEKIN